MDTELNFIEAMNVFCRIVEREGIEWGMWMLEIVEDIPANTIVHGY